MFNIFLKLFVIIEIIELASSEDSPIVEIPGLGKLRGRVLQTAWSKRTIYQFVDVKYAESPGGENRFKPPIPVKPWNEIRDVSEDGISCPSVLSMNDIEEQPKSQDMEDCLSFTITSHNLSVQAKQPVMVYIHGEYLYEGNNLEAAPDYILEKDVVLVAPQYRLGPFGFLSTMTNEIPGNAAIFDIVLALHWIQYFIEYFGGDPERVTLIGQVGGAAIAHLLTFSPIVSPGLFHQVIYHSGSALMPSFLTEKPTKFAIDIAEKAGCTPQNVDNLNHCLQKLSTYDLLNGFRLHALEKATEGVGNYGGIQFTIGGPSGVLPHHPSYLLLQDRNMSYPTIAGTPKNAGTRTLKEIFLSDFGGVIPDGLYHGEDYIKHIIIQTLGHDSNGILTEFLAREFFPVDILSNGTFKAMLPGLIDLVGTIVHKSPVLQALKRNAKDLPDKTWLFSFDYKGQFNRYPDFEELFNSENPFNGGVSLTDENIYLFPYPEHAQDLNEMDKKIAKTMVELWTSFAINGVPSIPNMFEWPPMTNINGPYLKIDRTFTISQDYFDEFSATLHDRQRGINLTKSSSFFH